MTANDIENELTNRSSKNLRIADDLAEIVVWLCNQGYTVPNDRTVKTATITKRCPEAKYQRLERLVELGMVNKVDKGPRSYIIHERRDEIVNGEDLTALIDEEIRRLCDHIDKDPNIEWVVSVELMDPDPKSALRSGSLWERQENLRRAIRAIENESRVSKGNYGVIKVRNSSNEYQATHRAVVLKQK
ncbi:hypothetical protein [Haloarchaeobius sp. FL176]|uniref:hypothetical protein n=1 Tax=Haloarchaeobius sp. FL176 TaxID=2967129 RepID=UPI002147C0DC|nr:hypothetical protein [Haloarchaeobius sp. FL176]